MKILIYFFSCLSLLVLVGCSPEQKCFNAQMKLWDAKEVRTVYIRTYGQKAKVFKHDVYIIDDEGKAEYEANAWARCMKR